MRALDVSAGIGVKTIDNPPVDALGRVILGHVVGEGSWRHPTHHFAQITSLSTAAS